MVDDNQTIPFGRPILGDEERDAVRKVLEGHILVHGPLVEEFEDKFAELTGAPHAVALSSCTAALHLSYLYLGIGVGDEVIVPAQTHTATAHAVEFCGATPIFADVDPTTGNIDINLLESLITSKTKAISVVHYLGTSVQMDAVCEVARRHDLRVIEDSALAVGTTLKGKHAGLWGDAGTFSFYPVKHFTTAEGGMLITNDPDLANGIRKLRAFGLDRTVNERHLPGIYDVTMLGYNYRMNELQAALGIEQLRRVPEFLKIRAANAARLRSNFETIDHIRLLSSDVKDAVSSNYCLSAVLPAEFGHLREALVKYLKGNGIGTSVYYPRPVPHLSYYSEKYNHSQHSFSNAAQLSYHSIALPVGPHLNLQAMDRIADTLSRGLKEVMKL